MIGLRDILKEMNLPTILLKLQRVGVQMGWRRGVMIFCGIGLVASLMAYYSGLSPVQSKEERDLEAIIASTGEFIQENREMFMNGLSVSRDIPAERASFYVNDIPVSHD